MALAPIFTARHLGAVLAFLVATGTAAVLADENVLVVHTASGDHAFNVEVVDTAQTRARGLMGRQELANDAGMLFDFKEQCPVSFWMKNTFIPLDMLFIDDTGVVKNVHVNARPHDETGIPSNGPVQYVLEIAGGQSQAIGVKPGDRIEHGRINSAAN